MFQYNSFIAAGCIVLCFAFSRALVSRRSAGRLVLNLPLLGLGTAILLVGLFQTPPAPGHLTAWDARARRAQVRTVQQQRQDWVAQQQLLLDRLHKQAAQAQGEAGEKLLQQIRIVEAGLKNAYFVTPVPADSARRLPAENAALVYQDEDLLELEAEPVNVRNRLSDTTDPLLAAHRFAELDAIASRLRSSRAQCANGTAHIRLFYDGFAMLPDYLPEKAWTDRIAIFEAWIAEHPASITPRVALANVWIEWAWRARSGRYASDVPRKGWELFGERLEESTKVLAAANTLTEKCPVWWELCQRIALGQSRPRDQYEALFASALRFDPKYVGFYVSKETYLLPRWFGGEGEGAAFIQEAADRVGGKDGDVLYARLIWQLQEKGIFKTNCIVKEFGASWPRLRRGLEAIVEQYPDSIAAASELCAVSGQEGEHERMRPLFARIGPFIDTSIFGERRYFLSDRRIAFR